MSDSPNNTLRAENNPRFYSRFKWLGLAAIGFSLYCVYDGYYTWPDRMVRGEAFFEVAQETLSEEALFQSKQGGEGGGKKEQYLKLVKLLPTEQELSEAWTAKAEAMGWSADPPAKLYGEGDIAGQYVMAVIAALGAVYFLTTVWRSNGRWVELNEEGIATSWGESFSTDQVVSIEKKQWKDKGIARVKYKSGAKSKTFVVDDYKYHRKTTDEILRQIELRAGHDKITGGKPEPDPSEPAPSESTAPDPSPAQA